MFTRPMVLVLSSSFVIPSLAVSSSEQSRSTPAPVQQPELEQLERPHDAPAPPDVLARRGVSPAMLVSLGPFISVQVNVNGTGNNILGDAANEPSIAINPVNPNQIAIGWRQFDSVTSDFREAGYAISADGGQTWTFPGVLEEDVFRSDPVLGADDAGNFYYYSLTVLPSYPMYTEFRVNLFKSMDGGMTWGPPVNGFGGDKQWMAIDRTTGIGRGNVYGKWTPQSGTEFSRSTDGGESFEAPLALPDPTMIWGTLDVGPDGTLYLAGMNPGPAAHVLARSSNAEDPTQTPSFDSVMTVDLGGTTQIGGPINPMGLNGQVWIATDHSAGLSHGNVYILGSVNPDGLDPLDVHLIRSGNGGATWSSPVTVNDDPAGTDAWQWFGTMSVAPNGRIDVIWNDTRNDDVGNLLTELFYGFSMDEGQTWSTNVPVTPEFDPTIGYPGGNQKLGDYYHSISDNGGTNVAYAATFNGEEDVYFLRIPADCNENGIEDDCDTQCGPSGGRCDVLDCGMLPDANGNEIPDECEAMDVPLDVKPQSCPNPLNMAFGRVLPVALVGTAGFDVSQVDVSTLELEGVSPVRYALEDVATPFLDGTGIGDRCFEDCHEVGLDGILDLSLKFLTQDVVAALGETEGNECRLLRLRGQLLDGTSITGHDVVVFRGWSR